MAGALSALSPGSLPEFDMLQLVAVKGVLAGWAGGALATPISSKLLDCFGNFNALSENFHASAVGRDKGLNFIGKSLNLTPYFTGAMTPLVVLWYCSGNSESTEQRRLSVVLMVC